MLLSEERNAGQMVSAPDILWKSRVPPWFIRTASGEEQWTKAETFRSLYQPVLSCLRSGLTFEQTSLEVSPALFSQGSSGSASCGDKFKQVGPVRRLLEKAAAPCLSLRYIFPLFSGWDAHVPQHWSAFNSRTDSSVKSQLDADWKNTRTVAALNFYRSSSQLSPDFSTCTTTNSDLLHRHICVYIHSHQHNPVNSELWPEHSVCCAPSGEDKTLVASHTCADFCIWLPLYDPPPWLPSGCWCFCVTGMGTNGTEAKVSWEEGLYTPQGSSSSHAFLIPAASACVLADDYVPAGGPWRLKRLDSGRRLHAVLFGVTLLSLCDVASYFQLSSPNRFK